MDTQLTPTETRILGVLIEKQATTPDVYPLTLNAVVTACNQKTSRDPVMNLSPGEVGHTLRQMGERGLVRVAPGARTERWEHRIDKAFDLVPSQRAILGLLFLRGPQTQSELLSRSERLHRFPDPHALEQSLDRMKDKGFVKLLPRQTGQREARWAHLLSGEPKYTAPAPRPQSPGSDLEERIAALEQRIADLEARFTQENSDS